MRTVYPRWFKKNWIIDNPPSSYKRKWRQEERTREKELLRNCRDYDALTFPPRHRLSSIYDWY